MLSRDPDSDPTFHPHANDFASQKKPLLAGYDCYQQFWNIRHTLTSIIQIPLRTSRVLNWKVRQSKSGWGGSELRWLRCIWRKIDSVYISLDILALQKRAHWKTSPVKSAVPIRLCEQKRGFKDYRRFRSLMNFIAVNYSHTFKRQCRNNRSRLPLF